MLVKKILGIALAGAIALSIQAKPATSGAEPGKWTMDFDAAKTLAKEKNLPILINFTGSDWCFWCKLMDKNVFSKQDWQDYAKDKIVLVWIDFPRNKALVPPHLVARNQQLAQSFGVKGYPTYIVLGSDGEARLGQLGASRTASPESFIADLEKLTK
jgi:thiol:disulfide interchange protein